METTFKPTEAVKVGWQTMKKHFWFFVVLLIIISAVQIFPGGIANAFKEKVVVLYVMLTVAAWIIQLIVKMGTIKVALDIFDKGSADYGTLFAYAHLLWKFILAGLLYSLIVLGGFLLLIIPGIIWAIKYSFFSYLIVDKNLSPMEAIKKSGEITQGNKGSLFLLCILLFLINIVGAICFLVGLFATIPVSMIAMAYVYRKMMGEVSVATNNVQLPVNIPEAPTNQPIM